MRTHAHQLPGPQDLPLHHKGQIKQPIPSKLPRSMVSTKFQRLLSLQDRLCGRQRGPPPCPATLKSCRQTPTGRQLWALTPGSSHTHARVPRPGHVSPCSPSRCTVRSNALSVPSLHLLWRSTTGLIFKMAGSPLTLTPPPAAG